MPSAEDLSKTLNQTIRSVVEEYRYDIFLLVGDISEGLGRRFIDLLKTVSPRNDNCLLLVATTGGLMHEAYRVTRHVHDKYDDGNFAFLTDSYCKSAGTLIALGADQIIMGDHAEFGPLDTQVRVKDEFGELQSSLIDTDALRILQEEVFTNFSGQFSNLLSLGGGTLTTQTALRVASELTLGLFSGIYSQINPIRFGERGRAIQVALEYGQRVGRENLKRGALEKLITGYPSHGFVIDRIEAQELFHEVNTPSPGIELLSKQLQPVVDYYYTSERTMLEYLSSGVPDYLIRWLEILTTSPDEEETEDDARGVESEINSEAEEQD